MQSDFEPSGFFAQQGTPKQHHLINLTKMGKFAAAQFHLDTAQGKPWSI